MSLIIQNKSNLKFPLHIYNAQLWHRIATLFVNTWHSNITETIFKVVFCFYLLQLNQRVVFLYSSVNSDTFIYPVVFFPICCCEQIEIQYISFRKNLILDGKFSKIKSRKFCVYFFILSFGGKKVSSYTF